MKPRTLKIIFWTLLSLFSLANIFGSITELMRVEAGKQLLISLGYPIYLLTILGVAKLIGIIALLQPKYKTIKEWAYAGFCIDFVAAAVSHMFVGDVAGSLSPIIFLIITLVIYFLGKKVEKH